MSCEGSHILGGCLVGQATNNGLGRDNMLADVKMDCFEVGCSV